MEYKTTTKLKQSTLWCVVEAKVKHDTQFYGIKGEVGVPPPPPPLPITFKRVYEML